MKVQVAINPRLRPNLGPVPAMLLGLMGIGAVVAIGTEQGFQRQPQSLPTPGTGSG